MTVVTEERSPGCVKAWARPANCKQESLFATRRESLLHEQMQQNTQTQAGQATCNRPTSCFPGPGNLAAGSPELGGLLGQQPAVGTWPAATTRLPLLVDSWREA